MFQVDQNEAQANLQFQDFSDTLQASSQGRSGRPTSQAYTSFSDMNDDDEESDELLNRERREGGAPSFWKFSYYQSLFDVTTNDVLDRLLWSAVPRFSGPTYLERKIRPNPDLYGPIWVGLTLIVTTSVSSNVASYLQTAGQSKHFWHTDYTRVSFAATTIVLYIFLVPLVLWAMLKYRKVESRYSLLETLCLYGYSLSIYVPISILWAVELWWLRWLLMTIGCMLSGVVLVATLWPAFRDDSRKVRLQDNSRKLFHVAQAVEFCTMVILERSLMPVWPSHASADVPLRITFHLSRHGLWTDSKVCLWPRKSCNVCVKVYLNVFNYHKSVVMHI